MEGVGGRKFFAREPFVAKLHQQFRSKWVRATFRISHQTEFEEKIGSALRTSAVVSAKNKITMATINKKVWREYFEKIISGKKKLELRLADFEVNEGDTLVLEEWDKDKKEYTGRKIEVVATYILKTKGQTFWPPEEVEKYGFQIIQFEPKND